MVEKYHRNPMLGNDKAMQGDAKAQYILSKEIYRTAKTQDEYKKAFKSFKKAADQGDAQAQYNLALMHEVVWQIVDNYDQTTYDDKKRTEVYIQQTKSALYWMKKSADQGFAKAEFQIGFQSYYRFDYCGDEKYYKEALKWLQSSAEKDVTGAQYYLGLLYKNNKYPKFNNTEKAAYWLNEAKDLKNIKEEFILNEVFDGTKSLFYEEGIDFARSSIRNNCEKGNAQSCFTLALIEYQDALYSHEVISNGIGYKFRTGLMGDKSFYKETYENRAKKGLEQSKWFLKKAYSCGIEAYKEWKKYELRKY